MNFVLVRDGLVAVNLRTVTTVELANSGSQSRVYFNYSGGSQYQDYPDNATSAAAFAEILHELGCLDA